MCTRQFIAESTFQVTSYLIVISANFENVKARWTFDNCEATIERFYCCVSYQLAREQLSLQSLWESHRLQEEVDFDKIGRVVIKSSEKQPWWTVRTSEIVMSSAVKSLPCTLRYFWRDSKICEFVDKNASFSRSIHEVSINMMKKLLYLVPSRDFGSFGPISTLKFWLFTSCITSLDRQRGNRSFSDSLSRY